MPRKTEKSQSDIVAFRSEELKKRIEVLATLDERKPSQMARVLMKKAVELAEREQGINQQV